MRKRERDLPVEILQMCVYLCFVVCFRRTNITDNIGKVRWVLPQSFHSSSPFLICGKVAWWSSFSNITKAWGWGGGGGGGVEVLSKSCWVRSWWYVWFAFFPPSAPWGLYFMVTPPFPKGGWMSDFIPLSASSPLSYLVLLLFLSCHFFW